MSNGMKLIAVKTTCRMPCHATIAQAKIDSAGRENDIRGLAREPLDEPASRLKLLDFHMLHGRRLAV